MWRMVQRCSSSGGSSNTSRLQAVAAHRALPLALSIPSLPSLWVPKGYTVTKNWVALVITKGWLVLMIKSLAVAVVLIFFRCIFGEEEQLISDGSRLTDFAMLPHYKLLFCRIPKAGSTAISDLVSSISPPPFPEHPSWTYHQPPDHNLYAADVSRILRDPTWQKVVIYREPLSRFLSAYRSKCEGYDGDGVCEAVFHGPTPSFADAIRNMILQDNFHPDIHFIPQAELCNLQMALPYFSDRFVLDRSSSFAKIKRILDQAHVDITDTVNTTIFRHFPPPGKEQFLQHNTHSEETSTLLRYYNHDCFIRLVLHHYQIDYFLLQLPCPEWAIPALQRTTLKSCMDFIQSHQWD